MAQYNIRWGKYGLQKLNNVVYLSPYCLGTFDGIIKKNMPGKLFFVFAKEGVPLVRTYVLCTRRRRNISLIEDLVR